MAVYPSIDGGPGSRADDPPVEFSASGGVHRVAGCKRLTDFGARRLSRSTQVPRPTGPSNEAGWGVWSKMQSGQPVAGSFLRGQLPGSSRGCQGRGPSGTWPAPSDPTPGSCRIGWDQRRSASCPGSCSRRPLCVRRTDARHRRRCPRELECAARWFHARRSTFSCTSTAGAHARADSWRPPQLPHRPAVSCRTAAAPTRAR